MPHILVVGAGLVGTAIAFEAAKAGADVTLLDRGPIAERGASRFGFGVVTWATAVSPTTTAYAQRGFARYLGLEAELGVSVGFRATTGLHLLRDAAGVAEAERQIAALREAGQKAVLLDRPALQRHEPALRSEGWQGAVAVEQGHLDLVRCARAWVARADSTRLTVRTDVEVNALAGDGTRLETSAGLLTADLIILAAGIWTEPLLQSAGITLPVFYSQAEFLYSDPAPQFLHHTISWGVTDREARESAAIAEPYRAAWRAQRDTEVVPPTLDHSLVQFADGHVRVGQRSRFIPAYQTTADPRAAAELLAATRQLFPAVDDLPNLRLGSRQVTFTPDHLPLVGPLPGLPRTLVVVPSTSPTILVPALAEALAAFAVRGEWDPALAEWRLERPALQAFSALAGEREARDPV
jgi:glycine/D-amino acid oxidase-like deaminating enzyme